MPVFSERDIRLMASACAIRSSTRYEQTFIADTTNASEAFTSALPLTEFMNAASRLDCLVKLEVLFIVDM